MAEIMEPEHVWYDQHGEIPADNEHTEPEPIQIRESVQALLTHDERAYADRGAAERSVIRRLVALGWEPKRAYAAVAYEADNR